MSQPEQHAEVRDQEHEQAPPQAAHDEDAEQQPSQQGGQHVVADAEQHVGQRKSGGGDYQAPEDKRLKWLQGQREGLIALVKAGKLDVTTAIAKAVRYDQHINSGVSSVEGAMMVAQLGLDLAMLAAERSAEESTSKPVAKPEQQQHQQPVARVTAQANEVLANEPTKPAEAKVLNAVRGLAKRFDPTWLAAAQEKLGVKNATGAFNTETLRAMRTFASDPALGANTIQKVDFLTSILPGEPFLDAETKHAQQAADTSKDTKADLAAQELGYASYDAYKKTWVELKLLGVTLRGGGHPHLAARLEAANAYLRNLHPGLSDEEIRGTIGWSGVGNGAYDASTESGKAHVHTMGVALDVDRSQNPWIFRGKKTHSGDEADDWYEKFFKIACRIYGGTALSAAELHRLGEETSTEELHTALTASSEATAKYLELCRQDEDTRRAALSQAGFSEDEIRELLPKMPMHDKIFHNSGRKQTEAKSFTNLSNDLLVALRDAAGLAWGGTDFPGANEQGDFMHFDCRSDSWGLKVYKAGLHAAAKKK